MTGKKIKRQSRRTTDYKIIPNYILYVIGQFFKQNRTILIASISMAVTWLAGFMLGMSFAFGSMGGF